MRFRIVELSLILLLGILAGLGIFHMTIMGLPDLPDFEIFDIVLTPNEPNPNLTARIRNNGDAFSGYVEFSLEQSGAPLQRYLDIGHGEETNVVLLPIDRSRLYFSYCGIHYGVRVDPGNLIRESNEGNNSLSRTLLKYGTPDACIVHPVRIGKVGPIVNIPRSGDTSAKYFVEEKHIFIDKLSGKHRFSLQVYVKIKNCGTIPITNGTVTLGLDEARAATPFNGLHIAPGETADVVFPVTYYLRSLKSCGNRPFLTILISDVPGEITDLLGINSFFDFSIQFILTPQIQALQDTL